MFKIAICDDDQILCDSMGTGNSFDLVFLDIEMEGMNGVETGEKIRKTLWDTSVQIVYISSKQSYAMELFQNRPLDFLIKPVEADKVMGIIKEVWEKKSNQSEYFEYSKEKEVLRVKIKDIIYLESKQKKVMIVCCKGTDEYYGSIKNAEKSQANRVKVWKEIQKRVKAGRKK